MTTHMICSQCGSLDVRADAWAAWDSGAGEWALHSTYDAKHCEACEGKTRLLAIDEATQIEIIAFGMIRDGENTSRLVNGYEVPEFYDVMVRATNVETGEVFILRELEDLDICAADRAVECLVVKYPLAEVSW